MSEEKTAEQAQIEAKEARIAELEARLNKIEEMERRSAQGAASFPAIEDEKTKIRAESVQLYGELSPFYSKKK